MVRIGQASIDENGNIHGGQAGNQTGKELNIRDYYLHKKGWRVFRAIDPKKRALIGRSMKNSVGNQNIGYDQYQRDTLWNNVKHLNYDVTRLTTKCETDCSALVRVCCAYSGIILQNFNTAVEPQVLLGSKEFTEITNFNPITGEGLQLGDILVTKTKGHTVIVTGVENIVDPSTYMVRGVRVKTVKNGSKGDYVKTLQRLLISRGFKIGNVDGIFGSKTEIAVKTFQRGNKLSVDGVVGRNTWNKLLTS